MIVRERMENMEIWPIILEDIRKASKDDEYLTKAQKFDEKAKKEEFIVKSDGTMRFKGRIYVPKTINLRE